VRREELRRRPQLPPLQRRRHDHLRLPPLVVYVQGNSGVPQPALSTPTQFYNFFSKAEPYSNLPQTVKIDADGPNAKGHPSGAQDAGAVCIQHIGQKFGDLLASCVRVSGKPAIDDVNEAKIENGLTHDQEHWTANVLGINQNFTSSKVAADPTAVVLDTDTPQPGDFAEDYEFDLRARGALTNDANLQGSAMVTIEWGRLMLEDIAKQLSAQRGSPVAPKKLGDPSCTGFTGGKLRTLAQKGLHVPLYDMGIVESIHLTAFHWVVDDLHRRLSLN